jgi:hypothetical protein
MLVTESLLSMTLWSLICPGSLPHLLIWRLPWSSLSTFPPGVIHCYSVTVLECYSVLIWKLPWSSLSTFPPGVIQCYSVTVLHCYSVTVLECYSVTVLQLQPYCVKILHCYSVTLLQCYKVTSSYHQILIVLYLANSIFDKFRHQISWSTKLLNF